MPASGSLPATKAILIVIDGPHARDVRGRGRAARAPTLAEALRARLVRTRVDRLPSLTPVCLSSLVTGAYPDVHEIPHLVWYHRGERRIVEYGSSFAALRRAGARQGIVDAIFNMNAEHLSKRAVTLYESLEEPTSSRRRSTSCVPRPHAARGAHPRRDARRYGPRRFFYFNLFESDQTARRSGWARGTSARTTGTRPRSARWLVTRDGFDLLVYYLPDYDFASHAAGPDAAHEALARGRRRCAPSSTPPAGSTSSSSATRSSSAPTTGRPTSSRRLASRLAFTTRRRRRRDRLEPRGMVYDLAERPRASSRSASTERPASRWRSSSRTTPSSRGATAARATCSSSYPDGLARAWARCGTRTRATCSSRPRPGFEFADLAGRHHVGGGSHGSLVAGDSHVPMLTVGLGAPPPAITVSRAGAPRAPRRRAAGAMRDALACRLTGHRTASRMVERQLRAARHRRRARARRDGARAARALRPRRASRARLRRRGAADRRGQTISQPYMVARICEALSLRGDERVLDVGTGSGYQAAVLAELARARCTRSSGSPSSPRRRGRARRRGLRRPGPRSRRGRHARPARARALRRDRRRGRRAGPPRHALRAARGARAGSSSRWAAGAASSSS